MTNPTWLSPVPHRLVITNDSMSFKWLSKNETGLPVGNHCGAYAFERKYHVHEGIDLYVPEGTPVNAVTDGIIVEVLPFTGPELNQPWWRSTDAIFIDTVDGVVVYGEIEPIRQFYIGDEIKAGEVIGYVKQVLTKDKGRPMSMLHLELHHPSSRQVVEWSNNPTLIAQRLAESAKFFKIPVDFDEFKWYTKPLVLRDPTPYLIETVKRYYS